MMHDSRSESISKDESPYLESSNRLPLRLRWLAWIIALGTIGPYVFGPIRLEQIVIYGLASLSVIVAAGRLRVSFFTDAWLAGLWIGIILLTTASTVVPVQTWAQVQNGPLSGVDALILPLAAMSLHTLFSSAPQALLNSWLSAVISVASINTLAAISSALFGLQWGAFWSSNSDDSTAARAAGQGRYSGLINQPAEAGFIVGLALIFAVLHFRRRPILMVSVSTLLIVGGTLTASKIFLVGALPIALFIGMSRLPARSWLRVLTLSVIGMGAWLFLIPDQLKDLSRAALPLDQLQRFSIAVREDVLSGLTANRFGGSATLSTPIELVMEGPRYFGYGFRGLPLPYDSAWVEIFIMGGIVGVAILVGVMVRLAYLAFAMPAPLKLGFLCLLLLAFGASVGFPVFTGNRTATILWVTITLFVACARSDAKVARADAKVAREL